MSRNRAVWDRLAEGSAFARTPTEEELAHPLLQLDTRGWLPGDVTGMDVLCLAAGGGWQAILYAAAGANVTVVDLSPGMLAVDQREAGRLGLKLTIVEASMDALPLEGAAFDIVHQPVSTCYVPRLKDVYAEVARVLRDGGLYVSQHKTPTSLQVGSWDERGCHLNVPYENRPAAEVDDPGFRESGAEEFIHRWDDLVGGLCRAGFVVEDLREPKRADVRSRWVAPYVRIKARRVTKRTEPVRLWTPGG